MKKINFVICGCGFIASVHAKAILNIDNAQLVGCADLVRASAERFAAEFGIKVYDSMEAVFADPFVDAVCLCTPNGTHAELAISALKAGKNVVVEKPMATTVADCERIIEASAESGAKLAVISQLRTSPDIARAREIIASGALGKLVLCDLYMKYHRDPEYYRGSWKGTKAMDGGGALMNQGIHGVDLLVHLVGMPKSIKSMTRTLVHDIEVEDTAVAILEFENGAVGVIEGTTSVNPGNNRRMEIHGSNGTMVIEENTIVSLIIDGKETVESKESVDAAGKNSPGDLGILHHRKQIENFVDSVLFDTPLIVDAKEGSLAVRVIEGIYESNS